MPVLFVGHGSPMNIISDNEYTRHLAALDATLPRPTSILVVSAHWLTRGTYVTSAEKPRQIYDFYGFPAELYRIRYQPDGAPREARELCESARSAAGGEVAIECDGGEWGLDHASWAVLRHVYPSADVPVWEMSLDVAKPAAEHYGMARALAPLREKGVLVVGSGNLVHNLRLVDFDDDARPFGWALEADAWFTDALARRDHAALIAYEKAGAAVSRAVPTNDHYLPMLYAIGLQEPGESLVFTHEGIQNGSVSMRCFMVGG